MKRHSRTLAVALLAMLIAPASRAAAPRVDPGRVPSGILHDLAVPVAHLERFDGAPSAPRADAALLRQAVFQLGRAALAAPAWPEPGAYRDRGGEPIRIGLVDVRYDRIRAVAPAAGAARLEGDRLVLEADAVEPARAFLAAPTRGHTHRGAEVSFVLDSRLFAGDGGSRPARVEADFGEGLGYRPVGWDEPVAVRYPAPGDYTVRLRAPGAEGAALHAAFGFDVRALVTPTPDDTLALVGTQPYTGGTAGGRAFVYLAPAHPVLTRPAVVVEGFDIDNTTRWDELYALLNQEGLIEDLRSRGYDAVVLDFTDATDYIQRNAFVLVDLLHQVQAAIAPEATYPVVGASMGGLVARYALAWMEANGDPHHVRNFVSFDVPHAGANIPLGIQYWLDFFSGLSAEAADLLSRLDTPAARQMLLYHHTRPPGATGQADALRAAFEGELAALGGWPAQPRRVALANGSGAGLDQGFGAGAQIIRYEHDSFLVDLRGNVWAVPDGGPTQILQGRIAPILVTPTVMNVTVSGTLPWDNAPGGSRNSMAQMDAVAAPYGDIVALHASHCFVPTVSALGVATGDPFYDIAGDPDLLAHTPFDALFVPAANEPHVTVTPANAAWLLGEIDPVATAVAEGTARPDVSLHAPSPNPSAGETTLRWRLASAAEVRVHVFDLRGRRVATLLDAPHPAGAGEVRWNGRDDRGQAVDAGLYFVRVQAGGTSRSRALVRLR